MARTRRYSIEIKDDKGRSLLFTRADWTAGELRTAIAQNLRLAGLPDDAGPTAPDGEDTEGR